MDTCSLVVARCARCLYRRDLLNSGGDDIYPCCSFREELGMMVVVAGLYLVVGKEKDTTLVVKKEKDTALPWKNDPWVSIVCAGVIWWVHDDPCSIVFSMNRWLIFAANGWGCILGWCCNPGNRRC